MRYYIDEHQYRYLARTMITSLFSGLQPLASRTAGQVLLTFAHNWPYLLLGALVAAALKLYADQDTLSRVLRKYRRGAVFSATGVAVATPLCSCGTTAVILGMLASTLPWAPIIAFMVSSPLTSPTELFYSAGLFGWPFALTFFGSSIALGLGGGFVGMALERAGWLANQSRVKPIVGELVAGPVRKSRPGPLDLARETVLAVRRLLAFFFVFAFIGYGLNNLIPAAWVSRLFGTASGWGVPFAATLGLPLYVNSDASLPLVKAFMDNGASAGATLAFLITGAGTSIGAMTGALAIARWRIVSLVVGTLWIGAIVVGYGYNLFCAALLA